MSDKSNLELNNLSIPEEAFDQFQVKSMYEEDEYITLSDIVPLEENSQQQLTSDDVGEIPYDTEVVVGDSNFDAFSAVDLPGLNLDETDTTYVSGVDNNVNIQQTLDENNQGRPKRTRKAKSYASDFIIDTSEIHDDKQYSAGRNEKPQPTNSAKRPRRGRKPKDAIAQSENPPPVCTESENNVGLVHNNTKKCRQNATGNTRTKKVGRKNTVYNEQDTIKDAAKFDLDNSITQNMETSTKENTSDISDTSKTTPRRKSRKKKSLEENLAHTSEQFSDNPNDQCMSSKNKISKKTRITKTKKLATEEDVSQSTDKIDTSEHLNNGDDKSLDLGAGSKSKSKRRKKTKVPILQDGAVDHDETEELDNLSLKALSQMNGDNTVQPDRKIHLEPSESDIDVGEELILTELKDTIQTESDNVKIEQQANTEVQDMELDETVETISNIDLNTDITSVITTENEDKTKDINSENIKTEDINDSFMEEDVSKRPTRRRAKKITHYEEESDEDPFANVELSDDEPVRRKKGKYTSDDEYVPEFDSKKSSGKKKMSSEDSDISEIDEELMELQKARRKKTFSSSPRGKKRKQSHSDNSQDINVTTIAPKDNDDLDDIEGCLKSSVIQASDSLGKKLPSVFTDEFQNFLANKGSTLKIKRVKSSDQNLQNENKLEIPVLDQDAKKTMEVSVQTNTIQTVSTSAQTSIEEQIPMKDNVSLTAEQSEKACEFLKSIVKTTSELGQLMTEKSEDFISKKINTSHVTDTFKMDYCVKKSFLLLKLAKHNIMQMEEDLAKQYEEFLKRTNLISHRQEVKTLIPKVQDNDSDCEIVEDPVPKQAPAKSNKPKFNPKTVFLNKELSIKIAKKPVSKSVDNKCKQTLKNKGTVWLSDSVLVKKVKPTQSFLAQDSRNKKPPDCVITEKMVSNFFENYYKTLAPSICAPFTSIEWLGFRKEYVCNYFVVVPVNLPTASTSLVENGVVPIESIQNTYTTCNIENTDSSSMVRTTNPDTLSSLCTEALNKQWKMRKPVLNGKINDMQSPQTLLQLCLRIIKQFNNNLQGTQKDTKNKEVFREDKLKAVDVDSNQTLIDNKVKEILCEDSGHTDLTTDVEDSVAVFDKDPLKVESESYHLQNICLKTLCYKKVQELFHPVFEETHCLSLIDDTLSEKSFILSETGSYDLSVTNCKIDDMLAELDEVIKDKVKSLFSLCVEKLQHIQKKEIYESCFSAQKIKCTEQSFQSICMLANQKNETLSQQEVFYETTVTNIDIPKSLKLLTFEVLSKILLSNNRNGCHNETVSQVMSKNDAPWYKVKKLADICFELVAAHTNDHSDNTEQGEESPVGLTINCVNTVSEEIFHNMDEENIRDEGTNLYDDNNYEEDYNSFEDETQEDEDNWASQVQLQEVKPCITSNNTNKQTSENHVIEDFNLINRKSGALVDEPMIAHVKLEPIEEPLESVVDANVVKTEPMDEMVVIPENVITKQERSEEVGEKNAERMPLHRQNSSSFDVDSFEDFVRRNKMMYATGDLENDNLTQGGSRVRRQHEPDYMNEYDPSLNLLVPQTFEPLSIENAKGVLMAHSSDEENNSNLIGKKKGDRKNKGRQKKSDKQAKDSANSKQSKEFKSKPPPPNVNEVAVLTRRMREKIRQEEKKVESSDSEGEALPLSKKKDKVRKVDEKSCKNVTKDNEIQCSNVDSTEQIEQNDDGDKNFTGFSAVDQNEISSYQKYVKFVYDKILPKDGELDNNNAVQKETPHTSYSDQNEHNEQPESPLIDYDEPTELLECEPTMPIFDDTMQDTKVQKKVRSKGTKNKQNDKTSEISNKTNNSKEKVPETITQSKLVYKERNGWHCYPINPNETKLYQSTEICLEKLPESFVQTYFEYQEIATHQNEDKEVDRLINLNTLNRTSIKEGHKTKGKSKASKDGSGKITDPSQAATPASDGMAELTASEDEGPNIDDELPPPVPLRNLNENNLAKSSLMNDSDSDVGSQKIKHEQVKEHEASEDSEGSKPLATRKRTKTKTIVKSENPDSLMLTADKMMNKELNLLHAPVVLDNEVHEKESKGPSPNKVKRSLRHQSTRDHTKNDEDSSSEEEKQWVSTKEKLLKRLVKKHDTTSADDAKRAKLVSEFIERRGGAAECRKRTSGRGRRRRMSSRKILEREKQMRVLSHELFGTPADPALMGTRHQVSQSYFKGRRNIRKVIDKKSLQRSTVISNMEEFERKCRLNQRQDQLRQLLGFEEGVNVLVINDELCLEYCFERNQPVVSVHPFFTKVMKAHQYEGVKFMWDACFETLERVESGHPGGGCILAHCMGLGKTLQVLALLHTVLTHPRVGMQRVLVCCPLSTVLNWVDEIHKWIGPVTDQIKVFELSKLKKTYERAYQLEDWYSGGGIFIIGYELFRSLTTLDSDLDDVRPTIVNKIRTALLDPGPDIVVCDEGHLLKNDCSVLAIAMSRVATKRRIVLTGTPMQNNLREYYCMVNFVKPNLLGTYSEYSNRFENPIMNGQHRDSREEDIKLMKQRTHILHKVLEGCLQRQEASVLYPYLPKKHEYTVFISLTKVQWDLYKHYINNYSTNNTRQSVLKDFHILQKIWSHPQVLHNFQTKRRDDANKIKPEKLEDDLAHEDLTSEVLKSEDVKPAEQEVWWLQYLDEGNMLNSLECSNKFVVVFKILDECVALGDKVLIFSTSLFTMDSLEYFLQHIKGWSLGQDYYRLDGSVPAEVRQKWCREYNAEHNHKTKLFLISTRAGCLGLNMVAANRVIILDTSWNPAHDIQSIFRVYRFGQKKDCYIYRLVALGTMEQKIYERSVTKQAVACRVVDEQQIDRHYNLAELTELYRYDEQGQSVAGGVAVGVEDVALLRVARHPALHAVHEHDSLLRGSSEQQLPEHERAAAWMQFQQEHAHKQMQNHLIPSFSMDLPPLHPPAASTSAHDGPSTSTAQTQIKTESDLLVPYQPASQTDNKPKKGRPKKNKLKTEQSPTPKPMVEIPQENGSPFNKQAANIQEVMAGKIMNILIQQNYQNQSREEVDLLVSTVRKIVAYGHVPKGNFDKKVAQQIADVLLMKDTAAAPAPAPTPAPDDRPRRGKPKKQVVPPDAPEPPSWPGRRRAAINADKQINSLKSLVNEDQDSRGDDDDWQADDDAQPSTTQPAVKPEPVASDSIVLLSDDDDPLPTTQVKTCRKTQLKKTEVAEAPIPPEPETPEVIPLHPSLLSNKNFIKIVAHTYLEGNKSLTEDAAMLAAQYSTSKAKTELEATGKPILNGPIYDIAFKVLGIDILRKLQKTNPVSKEAPAVKCEPVEARKPVVAEVRKPGPRLRTRGLEELTGPAPTSVPAMTPAITSVTSMAPAVTPVTPVMPPTSSVVPVGLINRSVGLTSNMTPMTPVGQLPPHHSEESILPDDDGTAPTVTRIGSKFAIKKPIKPIIVKAKLSNTAPPADPASSAAQPHIPKLVISAGKLLPAARMTAAAPAPVAPVPVPVHAPVPAGAGDTICLDSDEETPQPPPKKKMVATKSTAKQANIAPVPVSLTAASPQLDAMLRKPPAPMNIYDKQKAAALRQLSTLYSNATVHPAPLVLNHQLGAGKFVMVPASQQPKLAPASAPVVVPAPAPAPVTVQSAPAPLGNKTLCKPGDVLRITPTGQVEVISRGGEQVSIPVGAPAPTPAPAPAPSPPPPPTSTRKVNKEQPVRRVSSSSSSDSSRPSTPDDPLSILKDVVHIKAPEETYTPKTIPAKLQTVGSTSITRTKSGSSAASILPSTSKESSNRPAPPTPAQPADHDNIMKHISKTDTILKKLNKALGPGTTAPTPPAKSVLTWKKSSLRTAAAGAVPVDTIDLDSYEDTTPKQPEKAKNKQTITTLKKPLSSKPPTTKPATSKPPTTKPPTSKPASNKLSTSVSATVDKFRETPKKIVGSSAKDIIISITGKNSTLSTTSNSVTTTKRLAPTEKSTPSTSGVKRPAPPAPPPPKKPKNQPMTLKDFNIDDIDDIIELE